MLLLLPCECFVSESKKIQNCFFLWWNQKKSREWLYKCRPDMGPSPSFLPDIEKKLGRQKHEYDTLNEIFIAAKLLQQNNWESVIRGWWGQGISAFYRFIALLWRTELILQPWHILSSKYIEGDVWEISVEHDATLTICSSLLPVRIAATRLSTLWLTALCTVRSLLHLLCFSTFLWITLSLSKFSTFPF